MRDSLLKLYVKAQVLKQGLKDALKEENGQDLVEYAAVIVLVVLALAGGMSTLAQGINGAMTGVGAKVSTLLS
jgi:Flp pilus assembly pilin Flp